MKQLFTRMPAITVSILVGACSALIPAPVSPGESEAELIAQRGEPTHRYRDGKDHLLEYAQGPWGQQTYMARIGSDGKVISFGPVLNKQTFAKIQIGRFTKEDVLHTVGAPNETSYLSLSGLEVWSYPYKENGVWNSVMGVYFDKDGIVRRMENGPDLRYDPDKRFWFGLFSP